MHSFGDAAAMMRAVMDNIQEHINIMAPDGTVIWHNRASAGANSASVGGKCWEVFEKRTERCPHCVHPAILADGKPRDYEGKTPRGDGEAIWWVRAAPLRDAQGNIHAIIEASIDITDRKRQERERQEFEANVLQTQKLESLGVLAGGIAHDFNNLLVAILGNADLALAETPPGNPAHACLRDIVTASHRAADLCHQMLAYSGRGRFVVGDVDLNALISEMGNLLEITLSKQARLIYHLDPALPVFPADATQLRQIVMNLITNAADAIGNRLGTVTVTTRLEAAPEPCPGWTPPPGPGILLEVADTGCGMDEATCARIFEPFFTTKFIGRGLGLAAVQGIVRAHHGHIHVESCPGAGSRFRIRLPVQPPSAPGKIAAVRVSAAAEPASVPGGIVLLADDDEEVRITGRRMLEKAGFKVILAHDGQEALALFSSLGPAVTLVILDSVMPGIGGVEVARRLRENRPGLPVLFTSGVGEDELQGDGPAGAVFLPKPFDMENLLRLVTQALCRPGSRGGP